VQQRLFLRRRLDELPRGPVGTVLPDVSVRGSKLLIKGRDEPVSVVVWARVVSGYVGLGCLGLGKVRGSGWDELGHAHEHGRS
jgi:hypothetical protein